MNVLTLASQIVFVAALIFFVIYGALGMIVLWRFALSRAVAAVLTIGFGLAALLVLVHAFYSFVNL